MTLHVPSRSASPQHLSVVLSGAISLGAYHAGAVAQLGYFVANWNALVLKARARGEATDVPLVYIDVVSAASAGAMTGAILTKFLATSCTPEEAMSFVKTNRDIWCGEQLAFDNLLDPANTKDASFMSNTVIDKLAREHLFEGPARVELANGQRWLIYTCTMTSLNPIAFDIKLPDCPNTDAPLPEPMTGTTHRDWITFRFHKEGVFKKIPTMRSVSGGTDIFDELASKDQVVAEPQMWSRLGWSAMTSGAFPLAWQPVHMQRFLRFYPDAFKEVNVDQHGNLRESAAMTYTDGGVINNMPLDRAFKVLRDSINFASDPSDLFDNRTYVLIECNPVEAEPLENPDGKTPNRLSSFSVQNLGGPLFESMREQSFYADLKAASTINTRLENRVEKLWPILWEQAVAIQADARAQVLDGYRQSINSMLPDRRGVRLHVDSLIDVYSGRESIRTFLHDRLARVAEGESGDVRVESQKQVSQLFVHLAILSDVVADLHDKHRMVVMRVRPKVKLYGQMLGDFGGFLNPKYQLMDFSQAIQDTQEALESYLEKRGGGEFLKTVRDKCMLDAESFKPVPAVPAAEVNFDKVPVELKDNFFELILNRVGPWMTENFGGGIGKVVTNATPLLKSVVLKRKDVKVDAVGLAVKTAPRLVRSLASAAFGVFAVVSVASFLPSFAGEAGRFVAVVVGVVSAFVALACVVLFARADQELRS